MCTGIRFSDAQGNLYFARNLDWSCSYGEHVVITPTNAKVVSLFGATDRIDYPIIGMGITAAGTPLYFDCANERGLAVAGLNFPGYAHYEEGPVEGKTNVAAFEFPLWVVAKHATVDEVEAELGNVAIVGKTLSDQMPVSYLHWIIGDGTRSIVVEYTSEGMQVFHDDFDVLANQPGFAWHAENVRNYLNATPEVPTGVKWDKAELAPYGSGGGMRGIPGDYYSPSRFVRAAYLNANYPVKDTEEENVARMFHTLQGVSMIDGAARMFHTLQGVSMIDGAARMTDGAFEITVYTGGFSARTNTYYYNTYDDPAIRSVALSDYPTDGTELIEVK